jgi:hypothetical protein
MESDIGSPKAAGCVAPEARLLKHEGLLLNHRNGFPGYLPNLVSHGLTCKVVRD